MARKRRPPRRGWRQPILNFSFPFADNFPSNAYNEIEGALSLSRYPAPNRQFLP
jgi:hypothetical protein